MAINIVCTSKPCDGLLFYSYEYCSYLNSRNIDANLIIIPHRKFEESDYSRTISSKYIHNKNIIFNSYQPKPNDVTLIMGRSMMTLAYLDFFSYSREQQLTLQKLFKEKVIAVYSENHPIEYQHALDLFRPRQITDLCDQEVYTNGTGEHFEKRINFEIYKKPQTEIKFEYLFLGTNKKYYETIQKYLWLYPDHGILSYNDEYIDAQNNNVIVPIDNLIGSFNTFVYTKSTFDPAPRIIQECKYFGKKMIYSRDPSIQDGGSVYWKRDIQPPNIKPILEASKKMKTGWVQNMVQMVRG